jgi:hypothetical protein
VALALCGVLAVATASAAQTPASRPASGGARERQWAVGGIFTGPSSMGSANAELLGAGGTPSLTLFSTRNGMAPGFGPDLLISFRVGRALVIEADGGLVWTSLRTDISKDFESAADQTLSASVVRWSGEGAVLWFFHDRGNTAWFLRASAGVMGEASSDVSTPATGFTGGGGIGLRHWWRTGGTGAFKRVGLRAEFRANVQSGGLSLGSSTYRFTPAGTVHLVIGY